MRPAKISAHAEHRAGEGDAEGADEHLAGELAEEEQRQGVDHGPGRRRASPQAAPLPSAAKASGAAT